MLRYAAYLLILITGLSSGCATAPYVAPMVTPAIPGIYHSIEKGQTLWRISKIYDISLDELSRANNITEATSIEVGQRIFIPRRRQIDPAVGVFYGEDFLWPVRGNVIATFGQQSNNMVNKGINIRALSEVSIIASRGGRVIFYSSAFKGFGKTIIIDHGDGFSTIYSGISEAFVKAGDKIGQGSPIAKINQGSCLHFEIRKGYLPQNPYFYLS
jgi:murein DD-endopeptidase MepM/ murein hydrolase activator NlpD